MFIACPRDLTKTFSLEFTITILTLLKEYSSPHPKESILLLSQNCLNYWPYLVPIIVGSCFYCVFIFFLEFVIAYLSLCFFFFYNELTLFLTILYSVPIFQNAFYLEPSAIYNGASRTLKSLFQSVQTGISFCFLNYSLCFL